MVPSPLMPSPTRTDRVSAHDGAQFDGHLWVPERGHGPGVLLLQEIFGVSAYLRAVADRLVALGYVVLAPDVFFRIRPNWEADHDEAGLSASFGMMQQFDFVQGFDDCAAAFEHVSSGAVPEVRGSSGIVGFCLGGLLAYQVAVRSTPAAVVSYYGSNIAASLDQREQIRCPMLFHFGESDPYIPLDQVEEIKTAFAGRGDVQVHVHAGAGHAFDNHEAAMFWNPSASQAAWAMTTAFLRAHLG